MTELALLVVLAALAGHRGARAVAADSITKPWRDRLPDWAIKDGLSDRRVARRQWFVKLVECPHCLGFWLTWVGWLWLAPVVRPAGWREWMLWVLAGWAAAGIQTMLASIQGRNDEQADAADAQSKVIKADHPELFPPEER